MSPQPAKTAAPTGINPKLRQWPASRPVSKAALLIGLLAGAVLGAILTRIDRWAGNQTGLTGLFFLAYVWLGVVIHELGHAIASRLAGMRLLAFYVWPFAFSRLAGGWDVRMGGQFWGGYVLPQADRLENLRKRLSFAIAGGPAASFLAAGACVLAALLLPASMAAWRAMLSGTAMFSCGLGLLALYPTSGAFADSDGRQLLTLRKGGPVADRFDAILMLIGASSRGIRPRDYDPEMVQRLSFGDIAGYTSRDASNSHAASANIVRYNHAVDCGHLAQAQGILEAALTCKVAPITRQALFLEAAWFEAAHCRNATAAEAWLRSARLAKRSRPEQRVAELKARAAISAARQKWLEARRQASDALALCGRIDAGIAVATRDYLEQVIAHSEPV